MKAELRSDYLSRIGFEEALAPSKEVLFFLHKKHVFSVPFENLDIQLGLSVSTEAEKNHEKIVTNRADQNCGEGQ